MGGLWTAWSRPVRAGHALKFYLYYAVLWEQRSGSGWQAHHDLTASQYQQTFDQLVGQGYHLVQISGD